MTDERVTTRDARDEPNLYAWQAEALAAWRAAGRRGIVEAVTGTGKTRVGVAAIIEALEARQHAVVIVPGKELQGQWYRELSQQLPKATTIGLLGDGHYDSPRYKQVLVAIVHSASKNNLSIPSGALVVADETHRYATPQFINALDKRYERRLGLTATLERSDREEKRLLDYFGPVCYRIGYPLALADGVVSPFSVATIGVDMETDEAIKYESLSRTISDLLGVLVNDYGIPSTPFHRFMNEVKDLAEGSWRPGQKEARAFRSALFERKDLLANSAAKVVTVAHLAPAMRVANRVLVFTEGIHMAEVAALLLRRRGLRAEAAHSGTDQDARRTLLRRFGEGDLDVLVAPRILDEGIDVPAADLAVIVSASKTRRQMIQRMGRVLRLKEDGRAARLAIIYLRGTTEDPRSGAHEAFLSEITTVADDLEDFGLDSIDDALCYLSILEPLTQVPAARRVGEPQRIRVEEELEDEDYDAAVVLNTARAAILGSPPPRVDGPAPSAPERHLDGLRAE